MRGGVSSDGFIIHMFVYRDTVAVSAGCLLHGWRKRSNLPVQGSFSEGGSPDAQTSFQQRETQGEESKGF